MNDRISFLRRAGVALAGAAALVALNSCSDETAEKPAETAAPATAPAQTASTAARDALFEDMLFGVGKRLTAGVVDPTFSRGIPSPECWNELCNYLEKLEAYYEELSKQAPKSLELTRVALRVAQVRANLMSPRAFEDYEKALAAYESMSDADKNSNTGKEAFCDIQEALGTLLAAQEKEDEALPRLQQVVDTRSALVFARVSKEDIPNMETAPEGELAEALTAYARACTNLAVCKARKSDYDGARETIKTCSDLLKSFKSITYRMSIQYARLMATLGDVERVAGDPEAAMRAWREAAGFCSVVIERNKDAAKGSAVAAGYAFEAQALLASLNKVAKSVSDELLGEEEAPAEGEEATETEPEAAPEPQPEPAPEPEPAPAAAPAPAPAPAPANNNNKTRNRRR